MAKTSRGRLRQLWLDVHMWIGVGLVLALIPLSVSGSYLVWREEIDRATHPARFDVSGPEANLRPSAYLAAAQAAFGDRADASALRLPAEPGDPVIATGLVRRAFPADGAPQRPQGRPRTLTAWIDPPTGKVLEVADIRAGFSMWLHNLHGNLLIPQVGRKVVGWLGWAMTLSCLTGLWLWWPKNGDLKKAFRWRRSPDFLLNLHYLTGFWVVVPLFVLSVTGALVSFPQFARSVVGPFAPVNVQQPRGPGGPGGGANTPAKRTELTVDRAVGIAQEKAPGAEVLSVTLPTEGRRGVGDWRVQVSGRTEGAPPLTLAVDDGTGEARLQPQRPPLGGEQLLRLNRRIHDGVGMAMVWRVVITVAGLIPAVLGVTGVIVWAQRQLRKAAMRRRLADVVAQPNPAE